MSRPALATYVHVADEHGRMHVFGPDHDMSAAENEWAVAQITNPDAWDGGSVPVRQAATVVEQPKLPQDPSEDEVPPRSGSGSGRDAWAAYAAKQGVEVPEGASRDDIIAAVDQAKATA